MKDHPKWVLLGGDTIAGREIAELVRDRSIPARLSVCGSRKGEQVISASLFEEDDIDILGDLTPDLLVDAQAVIAAGLPGQAVEAREMAVKAGAQPVFIDVSGAFDNLQESDIRAPAFEKTPAPVAAGRVHTVAHPAAIAIASVLDALHAREPILASVVNVFEPASERGQEAIDEMHQQTMKLFSFQAPPATVFGVQACFNLLAELGKKAPRSLESSETRIERHLASLIAPRGVPLPALRLIHAPVFNGYTASLWVELGSRRSIDLVAKDLATAGVSIRKSSQEPLTNTTIAGQSGTVVSNIAEDRRNPRALWVWIACDNVRESALNAVALAGLASKGARR